MDDTGITGEEWIRKSQRGEVCGIVACKNKPTSQCPKCGNHYCYEHLDLHLHKVSDEEQAAEDRRDQSLR
jgi:hypothetical protein